MSEQTSRREFLSRVTGVSAGLALGQYSQFPAHAEPKFAREMNVELRFRDIICNKTTERGHDEVYAVISGVKPNGRTFSFLFPDPESPNRDCGDADDGRSLDMNDSGDRKVKTLLDKPLWSEPFQVGEQAKVFFAFYESDGQEWGPKVKAAAKLAQVIAEGEPTAVAVAEVVRRFSILIPRNEDDFLGAYSMHMKWGSENSKEVERIITPRRGKPWLNAAFVRSDRDRPKEPGRLGPEWEYFTMNLTGGGGNYDVQAYLRMTRKPD